MEKTIEENKAEFIKIFKENITRDGADKLLDYLLNVSDFFTAPASGRRHSAFEGGLCFHSLNVYKRLLEMAEKEWGEDPSDVDYAKIYENRFDVFPPRKLQV